jgi:ribosome-associated protein
MPAISAVVLPENEFTWRFVRSGGPGGQNVNKVASKAVLYWDVVNSPSLPEEVKHRLRAQNRRRFSQEGTLSISSQRFRDQDRNRQDCLEKLRELLVLALQRPKVRKKTRPTAGSREARLQAKKHHARRTQQRRVSGEE